MLKNQRKEIKQDMTLEEARAYRLENFRPQPMKLTSQQKRAQFKIFWAQSRKKYNKSRNLEEILWLHLKTIGCDEPENFEKGIQHFGLVEKK